MESGSEIPLAKKRRLEGQGRQNDMCLPSIDFITHPVPSGVFLSPQIPDSQCAMVASVKSTDVFVPPRPAEARNSLMQLDDSPVSDTDNTVVCFGVVGLLML